MNILHDPANARLQSQQRWLNESPTFRLLHSGFWIATCLLCLGLFTPVFGQQNPWEYSPYRVNVWMSISPGLGFDEESETELHRQIQQLCEVDFGGTWDVKIRSTPESLHGSVLFRIDELAVPQLLAREMTLVVGKSDEAKAAFLERSPPPPKPPLSKEEEAQQKKLTPAQRKEIDDAAARAASLNSVRTFESAIDRIDSIHLLALPYAGIQREIAPYLHLEQWRKFSSKLRVFPGSLSDLKQALADGTVVAAMTPKADLTSISEVARSIPARLPWQPEALFRDYDKIFLVSVDKDDELYRVRVKELDAFVRQMGELSVETVSRPQDLARTAAFQLRSSFTPIVRIEETDVVTATLRVRAGGLIVGEDHPARIELGDVVLPFIRRDDINGNPTLLQAMPFTAIAATEKIDQTSLFYGAIFAASRGALTAAKNRRTQRIGLKAVSRHPNTDLRLTFRPAPGTPLDAPPTAVPGAEIYSRTPGHEDLVMVGRTDWRGIISIENREAPIIQYEIPTTSRNPAIANARSIVRDPVPPPEYPATVADPVPETTQSTPQPNASEAQSKDASDSEANGETAESQSKKTETDKADSNAVAIDSVSPPQSTTTKGSIQINVPLYLYYVKNGDTLLARLPILTGSTIFDEAKLPDDRRRLETEAFLKGVQNELLDIVVRRKILETRIKKRIADSNFAEAENMLSELKRMKSYDRMSEQIENIQRRALDPARGRVGPNLEKRINSMVNTTRDIMQKWLQDSMLRDLETLLSESK